MGSHEYKDYKPIIGRNIKKLRTEQGLSLRKLGLMIGMSYVHLFGIEHAEASASIDALSKIASGLGVDVAALLDDADC